MHPGNAVLFAQWEEEKKTTSKPVQPKAKKVVKVNPIAASSLSLVFVCNH